MREYGPGQHGQRRAAKPSNYKLQLCAKQKLRFHYAMEEKSFRRVFEEAYRKRGDTNEIFLGFLESRLDVVVYRMKFASTIFAARQLVSHGHVKVNGRRVNIKSYRVSKGDKITLTPQAQAMPFVTEALQNNERDWPGYLQVNAENFEGVFAGVPEVSVIPYPFQAEPQLVTEWYSRRL